MPRRLLSLTEKKFEKHLNLLKSRPFNPHISDDLNLYIRDTLQLKPTDFDLKRLTWKEFGIMDLIHKCLIPGKWKAYNFLEKYAKMGEKYLLNLENMRQKDSVLRVRREEQLRLKSLESWSKKKKS